jgi:CO dehydrogenase/acetyl-CoA synthase beta subunit
MDEYLKQRIVDFFTPAELVDLVLDEEDTDAMEQLVEALRDYIEDNLEEVQEFINYGS